MPNWATGTVTVTGTKDAIASFVERFVSEDDCYGYYTEIIDNEKELDLSLPNPKKNLTIDELVDLMNELADENEWLKSEIQKLYNFVKIDVDHNIEVYPKSLMEHILEILKIIGDVE